MLGRVMMKITRLLATLLFLPLVLSLCLSASAKIPLIVQTTEGPVIGSLSLNGQRSFKGIPYASPPIGPLRWHAPQDPPYHELPLLCDSFRSSCPSYPSATDIDFSIETFSEDCLYLNIWTGAEDASSALPVMVYLHGGSFLTGSSAKSYYDGSYLASKGVVLVTLNYRLGIFGFFCHPALADADTGGSYGNYGLLDQVAALRWVKRNIASFGGNPDNITLFGESAGAVSVLALMSSGLAEGLFNRAIVQSGAIPFNLSRKEDACGFWAGMVNKIGVDNFESSLDRLREMEWTELLNANPYSESVRPAKSTMDLLCIDGLLFKEQPLDVFMSGRQLAVPLICGSNSDELGIASSFGPESMSTYRKWLERSFPGSEDDIIARYPADSVSPARAYMTAVSDAVFTYSSKKTALLHAAAGNNVYHYSFAYVTTLLKNAGYGAFHGSDVLYVFGVVDVPAMKAEDRLMAKAITDYWTSFARDGTPVSQLGPPWPVLTGKNGYSMLFSDKIEAVESLSNAVYEFWDVIIGKNRERIRI